MTREEIEKREIEHHTIKINNAIIEALRSLNYVSAYTETWKQGSFIPMYEVTSLIGKLDNEIKVIEKKYKQRKDV